MTLLSKPQLNSLAARIATVFGVGHLKPAPGTWGTAVALPFGVMLLEWPFVHMAACIVLFFISVWASGKYACQIDPAQDPSEVVVDEFLGMWIALVWLPQSWLVILLAFVSFRLLDIVKPFPISILDKKGRGGLGIVADDVAAGILTNVILHWVLSLGWLDPYL